MATRSIVPRTNSEGSLGTTLKRWLTAFIDTLTLTNPLDVASGGTGVSSLTEGGLLVGGGSGDITALAVATNGQIPIGDGTTAPTLATITAGTGIDITNGAGTITIDLDLKANGGLVIEGVNNELAVDLGASAITGTLAVGDGGTGVGTFTLNGILYGNAATSVLVTAAGTVAGQLLTCGATPFVPVWTTATYPATTTVNQLLYSSSANVIAGLATGNSGILVTSGAGVPSIATDIPTAVTIGSAYVYRAGGTDIAVADGGTNKSSWTQYSIPYASTTTVLAEIAPAASSVLVTNGSNVPSLATDIPTAVTIGAAYIYRAAGTDIPVTDGGTGVSTLTTAYGLLAAGTTATGTVQTLAAGALTEILVGGGASALPVWTTATGTGAPVRATSPTLVTPALGTPSSGDLQNCTLATPTTKGVVYLEPKLNLLTNSQWIVNSGNGLTGTATNSPRQTDFEVGSGIITGSDADFSGAGNWVDGAGWSVAGGVHSAGVGTNTATYLTLSGLTVGKLYKFNIKCAAYTGGTLATIGAINNARTVWITQLASVTPVAGQYISILWEATETNNVVYMDCSALQADFDDADVHEVTPGYVAADVLAPDGWGKDSGGDIWRQHSDATYTKAGSYYSLKHLSGGGGDEVFWPKAELQTLPEFYKMFAGRTVTLGMWIYASDAASARPIIFDNTGNSGSNYHTGAAGWEWVEITRAFSASITSCRFSFRQEGAAKTAYFSQPMLVFGSSIGQGNYAPIPNEVIWLQTEQSSNALNNKTFSSVGSTLLNTEADSNGVIGKGAKALKIKSVTRDSGSAADVSQNASLGLGNPLVYTENSGLANDALRTTQFDVKCDANGDINYVVNATGASTFDITSLVYRAIQTQ